MTSEMIEVNQVLVGFIVFILVILRCGCLVVFAPFFGSEMFPARFRVLFALGFSFLIVPAAARTSEIPQVLDMLGLALLAGQEVVVGLIIGFLASFIFMSAQFAGEIAGQQIGFSMANVLDPISNVEVQLLGFIKMNISVLIFLVGNLHLIIIYIMFKSYDFIPIGGLVIENISLPTMELEIKQADLLFKLGLQMAMPIIIVMLLNSVVEGFVTRTMPQMNIMVFGMPLRVVLGLTALLFILPATCAFLLPETWRFNLSEMPDSAFGDMLIDLSEAVRFLGRR